MECSPCMELQGIIFWPKMMISQGVGHPMPQLGGCCTHDQKNGGGDAQRLRLRLIYQPSSR